MSFSRLGLLGDVHAEVRHLEAALHFFAASSVEAILCVGDIADGQEEGGAGHAVNGCCRLLQAAQVRVVRGNHDRWLLASEMRDLPDATPSQDVGEAALAFLKSLPRTQRLETVAGPLLLCHGVGENDMARLTPDDYGYALECNDELQDLLRARTYRFIVGGHTHYRMVRHFGALTFINPGTLTAKHQPCLALADFRAEQVKFHDFVGAKIQAVGQTVSLHF